ncbi:MAG: hypothetical protein LLG05_15185 [Porphyromonadaceae bacterium]|nr:hypothetical protein [Porphyromonadaceae bacterium]
MGEVKTNKTYIECECGTHLLQVQTEIELFPCQEKTRFRQEFWLAMFSYRQGKDSIWRRLVIAFKYLRTGQMHLDQMILTNEEASKLANFINENILEEEEGIVKSTCNDTK